MLIGITFGFPDVKEPLAGVASDFPGFNNAFTEDGNLQQLKNSMSSRYEQRKTRVHCELEAIESLDIDSSEIDLIFYKSLHIQRKRNFHGNMFSHCKN